MPVSSVSISGSVPGMEVAYFASNRLQGDMSNNHKLYEMLTVDDHFIETFGFELLAGRSFKKGFGNDIENILINELAAESLGFAKPEQALGKRMMVEGQSDPVNIIGIVKNWHQRGLGNPFTPIVFLSNGRINWISPKYIAVKSNEENIDATIAYYGHADPLYGDIDPPIGNWIKEFDSMTILPFFS